MNYRRTEQTELITLEPTGTADAAIIWLHGLGADGHDFVPAVEALQLPSAVRLRFLFPHAAARPVTINQGFVMRAWYDIKGFTARDEDEQGIRESEAVIQRLIEGQLTAGLSSEKIIVAGFSQGGAMALHTSLRYPRRLAGVLALSTYLPLASRVAAEAHSANRATPILMCHGTYDGVVPLRLGEQSKDALVSLGCNVEWRTYAMAHEVNFEQLTYIGRWLQQRLSSSS